MVKLRKANSYRKHERAYSRISKFRELSYIRTRPNSTMVKFDVGNPRVPFTHQLDLISLQDIQLRHNCMEAARQTATRYLEKNCGKDGFRVKFRVYPHHILRENPLASGAGADRMSTGMQRSFGKPISTAARVHRGQTIVTAYVNKNNIDHGKIAMRRIYCKYAGSYMVEISPSKILAKANKQ